MGNSLPAYLRPACRCESGFTILELLAVVFIMSMVAALAFPSFSWLGEKQMKSEARKVASVMRHLNDSSIYSKSTSSLKFDLREGIISWEDGGEKRERLGSLAGLLLQSKGEVKEGQVTLLFGPLGLQEYVEVYLREGDDLMTVVFNPVSGRTKISEGHE